MTTKTDKELFETMDGAGLVIDELKAENADLRKENACFSELKKRLEGISIARLWYEIVAENEKLKAEIDILVNSVNKVYQVCEVCHLPMFLWKKGENKTCYSCRKLFSMKHEAVMKGNYQTEFTEGMHRQALMFAYLNSAEERDSLTIAYKEAKLRLAAIRSKVEGLDIMELDEYSLKMEVLKILGDGEVHKNVVCKQPKTVKNKTVCPKCGTYIGECGGWACKCDLPRQKPSKKKEGEVR